MKQCDACIPHIQYFQVIGCDHRNSWDRIPGNTNTCRTTSQVICSCVLPVMDELNNPEISGSSFVRVPGECGLNTYVFSCLLRPVHNKPCTLGYLVLLLGLNASASSTTQARTPIDEFSCKISCEQWTVHPGSCELL